MAFNELRKELADARLRHSQIVSRASGLVKGVLVVGGAAIAGVCQFINWPANTTPPVADVVGMAATAAVALGGLYVLGTEQDAARAVNVASEAIEEAEEATAKLDDMQEVFDAFDRLAETYQICLTLRGAIEQIAVGSTALDDFIAKLFDLISRPLSIAAGFAQADQWTLGVYKAEPSSTPGKMQLRCISHHRAVQCQLHEARVWPEGVGIAGLAFSNKREIVVPDLRAEGMQAVFGPQGHQRATDAARYVSMVAVPITQVDVDSAWGVLNATSDRPDHFSAASNPGFKTDEPVRAVAAFIGLAVAMWAARSRGSPGLATRP